MSLSLVAKRPIKSHSNEKIVQRSSTEHSLSDCLIGERNNRWYNTKNSRNTNAVAAAVHKDQY